MCAVEAVVMVVSKSFHPGTAVERQTCLNSGSILINSRDILLCVAK